MRMVRRGSKRNVVRNMNSKDNVHNPNHYVQSGRKMQPIQCMYYGMTLDEFRGYCMGNVHKYTYRYNEKNGIEDLEKARTYLSFLINAEKGFDPLYNDSN